MENKETLRDEPTPKEKSLYDNSRYRQPRIYKVSDWVEIAYLNEKQYANRKERIDIARDKLRLISMFKNVK